MAGILKISSSPDVVEYDPVALMRRAPKYEAAGFDYLWEGDHTLPWHHTAGHCSSATVMLEAYLATTKRVKVGFMVLSPIGVRNNPVDVALICATMANLHPGRMALCVGTGEAMNERTTMGFWPSTKERVDRLEESIQVIKKCWSSKDYFRFKGKYFKPFFYMYDKPKQRIPLFCAASGPHAAAIAGKYADGFVSINPPEYFKDVIIPTVTKAAKAAGRDPRKIERAAWISTFYDPDYDKALTSARRYGGLLIPECYHSIDDPRVIEARANLVRDDILAKVFGVSTSSDQLISHVEQFIKVGVNHPVLAEGSPNPDGAMRTFKKVIDYLKDTYKDAPLR
jgi:coenzyme F420-dependent glucose-6-phosphate dehydrogenase